MDAREPSWIIWVSIGDHEFPERLLIRILYFDFGLYFFIAARAEVNDIRFLPLCGGPG